MQTKTNIGFQILKGLFFILFFLALFFVLALVREISPNHFNFTESSSAENRAKKTFENQNHQFGESFSFEGKDVFPLYLIRRAPKAGERRHKLLGFAFEQSGQTLRGPFRLLLLINSEGRLISVQTLEHSEWLGMDQVLKSDSIIFESLLNKSFEELRKDEISRVIGAAQTSENVFNAVAAGMSFYDRNKNQLLEIHPYVQEKAAENESEAAGVRQLSEFINPDESEKIDEPEI